MEPLFSLRNVLQAALRCKLMKEGEIQVWEDLIDVLHDRHLQELWAMFSAEHAELSSAMKSLDDYLRYLHASENRRQAWLQSIENDDAGVAPAVTAILQSKRHWTGPQVDEAFKTDESLCLFLASLSIRDLEQMRTVIDLHDQAGEYDDDEGKPTKARETLIGIVAFLQEDAWEAEQKEAEALLPLLKDASAPSVDSLIEGKAITQLGLQIRKGCEEFGHAHTSKAADKVRMWTEHQPAWFTMTWEQVKAALEAASLTVNVSGTLAGLGASASHMLMKGLGERIGALAKSA